MCGVWVHVWGVGTCMGCGYMYGVRMCLFMVILIVMSIPLDLSPSLLEQVWFSLVQYSFDPYFSPKKHSV